MEEMLQESRTAGGIMHFMAKQLKRECFLLWTDLPDKTRLANSEINVPELLVWNCVA